MDFCSCHIDYFDLFTSAAAAAGEEEEKRVVAVDEVGGEGEESLYSFSYADNRSLLAVLQNNKSNN